MLKRKATAMVTMDKMASNHSHTDQRLGFRNCNLLENVHNKFILVQALDELHNNIIIVHVL